MTDRIDLDELADSTDEPSDGPNRGDWLWREEEPAEDGAGPTGVDGDATRDERGRDEAEDGASRTDAETGTAVGDRSDRPVPHVPRPNKDKPVGIPVEGGGADGGHGGRRQASMAGSDDEPGNEESGGDSQTTTGGASGPHGGGADDMTMALTYEAATRLADPAAAIADASRWADWVGIVGDVEAHVINKFQRDHHVDVDFFNGSGTDPGDRLADIGEHSMFFAERMVVVGVEGRDEPVADAADWEFVPLATAAGKADWRLEE